MTYEFISFESYAIIPVLETLCTFNIWCGTDAMASKDTQRRLINSLPAKSCYGGEKHQNPVGFYCGNSTESTVHHKHNNPQHHHHGGAVCPSYGMGSMDPPNQMRVTSSEGFGRGGGVSVLIKSINF
jgi:hypothetical protein